MTSTIGQPPGDNTPATREEIISALFAHMVIQQTNLCMMLLGKVAHPQTGKVIHDLDSAKLLIDQLEMLEEKTKGNLSKEESDLLKEAQTALRMAFVEAVEEAPGGAAPQAGAGAAPSGIIGGTESAAEASPATQPKPPEPASPAAPAAENKEADDSRKRFSKKY